MFIGTFAIQTCSNTYRLDADGLIYDTGSEISRP